MSKSDIEEIIQLAESRGEKIIDGPRMISAATGEYSMQDKNGINYYVMFYTRRPGFIGFLREICDFFQWITKI